ncbi:hypothetical protein DRN44_07755 [Thermococci archaeon]|nr:MAG: hypothetical protein DRN44_07755 [Thermococci archaeon]
MHERRIFREAFSHLLDELNIPNIAISLHECEFEKIRKAHDSIHEFTLIPVQFINSNEDFQAKSAFLYYHWEIFDQAHRSLLEALSGYYNAAYVLLRNTLELILKGAFWECMAHKKYRDRAEIIKKKSGIKIENSKKTLIDWINDVIKQDPSIEHELERISVGIYDKISPLFEDETLRKGIIPKVKPIVEQLAEWKIFDPLQRIIDPVEYIYNGLYKELSADVHVTPDTVTIGRRLLAGEDLFETKVILDELNKYAEALHKVMDIGIVVELNILEDLMNDKSKKWLEERLGVITELELNYASTKIVKMIESKR